MARVSFLSVPSGFKKHFILRLTTDEGDISPVLLRIKSWEAALLAHFTKVIFLILQLPKNEISDRNLDQDLS